MVLAIQAFALFDAANSTLSDIYNFTTTYIIPMQHEDTLNCLLHLLVPEPSSRAQETKKIKKINKIFNSNNKKYNFLPVKNIVLLRKRRSCTRNGHQPQTIKLQSAN
jgi:hypothetical protein